MKRKRRRGKKGEERKKGHGFVSLRNSIYSIGYIILLYPDHNDHAYVTTHLG